MLSQLEISHVLNDVGQSSEWIKQFMTMSQRQQQTALNGVRQELLRDIHQTQASLECLDYLRYQLN